MKQHYTELERTLSAGTLIAAWRSQVRQIKQTAKGRMNRLHDLASLPEAEEQMKRDVEAVTLKFFEEAQRHGLPVRMVSGRLRMDVAESQNGADNRPSELSLSANTSRPSPWIQRRLRHHLRYGFDAD